MFRIRLALFWWILLCSKHVWRRREKEQNSAFCITINNLFFAYGTNRPYRHLQIEDSNRHEIFIYCYFSDSAPQGRHGLGRILCEAYIILFRILHSFFFFFCTACALYSISKPRMISVPLMNKPALQTKAHPEIHQAGIIMEAGLTESKSKCCYLLHCCNFRRHHVWLTAVAEHLRSALTHHLRGIEYDLVSLSRWLWVTVSMREPACELLHSAPADMFIERAACRDKRLKMGKA